MTTQIAKGIGRHVILRAPCTIRKGFEPPQPAIPDVPTGGGANASDNADAINAIIAALQVNDIILP